MSNPWAPKSAFDEAEAPAVEHARRRRLFLRALWAILGFAAGYLAFDLLYNEDFARLARRLSDEDTIALDLLFSRLVLAAVSAGLFVFVFERVRGR